jgi:mono/diheme cytochrome c family protein
MRLRSTRDCSLKHSTRFALLLPLWVGVGCDGGEPSKPDPGDCVNTFPVDMHHEGDPNVDHGGTLPVREAVLPEVLSETVLYADIGSKAVHPAVQLYTPRYPLWSDAEGKNRWVYIPECETIDTRNPNDWSFPVGTRFFKEFSRDGRRIETRLIERIGAGPRDFAYASYQWNESETEATRVNEAGVLNVNGTGHNIPSKEQCLRCHGTYAQGGGRPSRGLGFSALQLAHDGDGVTVQKLLAGGRLGTPVKTDVVLPGDTTTQAALGYLHANCGNCHNPSKDGLPQTDLNLWLDIEHDFVEETGAYKTAVGQATRTFADQNVTGRVVPGDPEHSALHYRMSQRGNNAQMPPIATDTVDLDGLAAVRQWIEGLQ